MESNTDKDFLGPLFVLELSSEKAFLFGSAGKESACDAGFCPATWVLSLGWEDPLKKEKATHSGILAWRIP